MPGVPATRPTDDRRRERAARVQLTHERVDRARRDREQQATRRLRVGEQELLVTRQSVPLDRLVDERMVALRAARDHAVGDERTRTIDHRDRARIEIRGEPGRDEELAQVPEQAEAGDVGRRVDRRPRRARGRRRARRR